MNRLIKNPELVFVFLFVLAVMFRVGVFSPSPDGLNYAQNSFAPYVLAGEGEGEGEAESEGASESCEAAEAAEQESCETDAAEGEADTESAEGGVEFDDEDAVIEGEGEGEGEGESEGVPGPTLQIQPGSATITINDTQQFHAYYDADGPGGADPFEVTADPQTVWSSDDPSIASVNEGGTPGLVRGVKAGSTLIHASYQGLSASPPAIVTVRVSFLQRLREILPGF